MTTTPETVPRTVLITGGATGIGRSIALGFAASSNYRLVINYVVDPPSANALVQEITALGVEAAAFCADVTDAQAVKEMFLEVEKSYGGVDILINNAGITRDALALRMDLNDWLQVINVNLNGAFYCSQAALRGMIRQRWGRIINMASVVGVIGNPGQSSYAASKAGLIGLTKSLARELATRGITVNALAPGFIKSAMTAKLDEEQIAAILSRIPLGYLGEPEDVANAALFLASNEARYITGQVLHIDGGLAM
ncbi:MAG: 3-oxoacyl-[acyl-carrier-protein] reductase [Symbiobacteriaceae bacterium]|nr:3-oxoacyl-[acyl-carrier-protein] reductase [Symbiobacteriaceae bacterium]